MNSYAFKKISSDINYFTIALITISLILLQHGFTYYISFQVMATIIILLLIVFNFKNITIDGFFLISFAIFSIFLSLKAIDYPFVLKRDYTNIFITLLSTIVYALIIGSLIHFKFRDPIYILRTFMIISRTTLFILFFSLVVSELNIFSFFNRYMFYEQNASLIDNFTDLEAIINLKNHSLMKFSEHARVDLYYGEPSFLAIVTFACLGCFFICQRSLEFLNKKEMNQFEINRETIFVFSFSFIIFFYIRSFSGIIYGIIALYYLIFKSPRIWKNFKIIIPLIFIFAMVFVVLALPYFQKRLDISNSLSLYQRFNFFAEYGIKEYFFGINSSQMPFNGISNGFQYIVATSGFGGLLYLLSTIRLLIKFSRLIIPSGFIVLLFISIVMQNGAVFSPSKIVLFSLITIPISCCSDIVFRFRNNKLS